MGGKARLTRKRKVFIEEYLRCWNATEAARIAGYKFPNRQGSFLLSVLGIQEAIEARIAEKAMSADEVLLRLAEHARGDLSEFVGPHGAIDWVKVKEKGRVLKSISHTAGKQSKIELYDAQSALALIGKHHRLFVERSENLDLDLSALTTAQLKRIAAGEDVLHVLATPEAG